MVYECHLFAVMPELELKPNCSSDRAWVWSTPADFADEEPKGELLAIRFANAESMCCPSYDYLTFKQQLIVAI